MENNTAQRILDITQKIVRNRGYSAFSYADIAAQIGIRKASIHYHFPSKEILVQKLVVQYRETLGAKCAHLTESGLDPAEQLKAFVRLYWDALQDDQICLCAMLVADFAVLPDSVRDEIRAFFQETENWLAELFQQGTAAGLWECDLSMEQEARGLIALLQGSQLLARSQDDSFHVFDNLVSPMLARKYVLQ